MGRLGRPGLGRRPGLSELPAWRPPLRRGFASAITGVLLPKPSAAYTLFLFFAAARWAGARPRLCSVGVSVQARTG